MIDLDKAIKSLKEWIEYRIAEDIVDMPEQRKEYQPYVSKCLGVIPKAAIPYAVLVLMEQERNTLTYKIKKLLKCR